jgi:xylan 1,4-beta-xylosidase
MGTQEIFFESSGSRDPLAADQSEAPNISGFATLSGSQGLQVLIYNHHDDWHRAEDYEIELIIEHLPIEARELILTHYRIDQAHSNAYAEWLRQGKPMYPAPGQRQAIKAHEGLELRTAPQPIPSDSGRVVLNFTLPVHGISLLTISPAAIS